MRRRLLLFLVPSLAVLSLLQAATGPNRKITEKDLFDFQWVGDPQLSPDGSRIAFVKVIVDKRRQGYESSLWTLGLASAGATPLQLTNGPHDASPRWSPDGKSLAFTRPVETNGKTATQIELLSFAGGEPHPITSLPRGVSGPSFSPDGKHLLFLSDTSAADDVAKTNSGENEEHHSDVRVITHAMYRLNGAGYLDFKHPSHIWVMDVPPPGTEAKAPRQVTTGRFNEGDPVWSPDSTHIYFLTVRKDEPYYEAPQNELERVGIEGGAPERVSLFPFVAQKLAISPDGTKVAFLAGTDTPVRSYTQPDLWLMDLKPGASPVNLTANYDYDIDGDVGGDNMAPRAAGSSAPVWTADGRSLIDSTARAGAANLVMVNATTGQVTEWTHGPQAVQMWTQSADRAHMAALISTPVAIGDLFTIATDGSQRQVTNLNEKLFSSLTLTQPEEIWFNSFDSRRIQMWVQKPPDFDPAKKYPLVLDIHGGPHSAYGWVFDHEFQWMAAKGYVVVYPNPRGSTSYGQEFGNLIQYKYPGDDFRDLMAAVDEVIKRGYVDPQRLGVTGGSGGGVLTDWTVTHTNRFKAAVSQRDISDWTSWWYTDDFLLFQPTWFRGAPFNVPGDFKDRSAMTFVKKIQTPMMFILGEADYRTPPTSGGEQLFRALKYMKEPTVMVRFPGESHELSRSGQPWHRVERLEHIAGWFDKYLDGEDKPEYDIVPGVVPQPAPHPYVDETVR
ncbi:MAG TPA: S9 family peptidase [Bryobacteraceae bacterium]|nr:S9 family peptidase [Bryobacteraceae bacterium]